ncbi:MAG: hypothetical protein A4E25_01764 [Methanobacterium sp. PtaB.Bin024]|nr:MAG: hypothetical protein A4E25_01764 [Methanobacterium sp. PtaB.Bin024]
MDVYSIFGINIISDFNFTSQLKKGVGAPDLTFKVSEKSPIEWSDNIPIYPNKENTIFNIFNVEKWDVIRLIGSVDYYITNNQILCHIKSKKQYPLIEIQFLGIVLSYWLEKHGIIAIHASAVNLDGNSVGFMSSNRGGKTLIAAALMHQGYPLISDDILALEVNDRIYCRPSYPTMRMWPNEAVYFLGRYKDLPTVHPKLSKRRVFVGNGNFGYFFDQLTELKSLYIPMMVETDEIKIQQLSKADGVIELVRHSFIAQIIDSIGWQPARLEKLTKIIQKVSVKHLIYPRGYQHLPRLCEAILDDADNHR